jgi:hypothetical protein
MDEVRLGAVFGLAVGAVQALYAAVIHGSHLDQQTFRLVDNSVMMALVILFVVAGFLAARRAQNVRASTSAGAAAALVGAAIGLVALWLATAAFFETIRTNLIVLDDFRRSGAQSLDEFIVQRALAGSLFSTLFTLILGLTAGSVGGIIANALRGRQRPTRRRR